MPQAPAPVVSTGMRPNCEVAVFIDGPRALAGEPGHSTDCPRASERAEVPNLALSADGIPFFRSANGVILTPGNADGFLLPKYFKEALQLLPTRENHPPSCSWCLEPVPSALSSLPAPSPRLTSVSLSLTSSISGKALSLVGNEETECQSGPKHSSRGRRMIQQ